MHDTPFSAAVGIGTMVRTLACGTGMVTILRRPQRQNIVAEENLFSIVPTGKDGKKVTAYISVASNEHFIPYRLAKTYQCKELLQGVHLSVHTEKQTQKNRKQL